MKKALFLLAVMIFVTTLLSGCSGVGDSYSDRLRRGKHINDLQTRMLVDDWDYFWLYEHNTYLSEWYPRVGN
jgi:outer membrane protein assembly factor BamE (lipoprotein component of BamABCDE complex)